MRSNQHVRLVELMRRPTVDEHEARHVGGGRRGTIHSTLDPSEHPGMSCGRLTTPLGCEFSEAFSSAEHVTAPAATQVRATSPAAHGPLPALQIQLPAVRDWRLGSDKWMKRKNAPARRREPTRRASWIRMRGLHGHASRAPDSILGRFSPVARLVAPAPKSSAPNTEERSYLDPFGLLFDRVCSCQVRRALRRRASAA